METLDVINGTLKISETISAFEFEVYDIAWTVDQFKAYRNVLYLSIGTYLLFVYFGQRWMEKRTAFKLTRPCFVWNAITAVYSVIATVRGAPELLYLLIKPHVLYNSTCSGLPHNFATSFWFFTFVLSRVVALWDTAFNVLRKQKVTTLQWFHHAATLLLCWLAFENYDAMGRYFVVNTFIHCFSYSNRALMALNIKIPKILALLLRTTQILEMVVGAIINVSSLYFIAQGFPCKREISVILLAASCLPIFAILHINLIRQVLFHSSPVANKKE